MRTRANGPVSPPTTSPSPPPLPDTVTIRKRRRESAPPSLQPIPEDAAVPEPSSPSSTRRSKKVRFSEPGRLTLDTGLTPGFALSTLSTSTPRVINTPKSARRRVSRSSDVLSPPTTPAGVLNFNPLRHGLDERLRRRLTRSHLSEEQNALHDEEKAATRVIQAAERLQQEKQEKDEKIRALELELELERQNHIQIGHGNDETCRRLQEQIALLQAEGEQNNSSYTSGALPSSDMDMGDGWVDDDDDWAEGFMDPPSSGHFENASDDLEIISPGSDDIVGQANTSGAACQTSLETIQADTIAQLQHTISSLNDENADLKNTLSSVHAQLLSLGFSDDGDSLSIINSINILLRSARLELERLYPGETALGLHAGKDLLLTTINHIKNLVNDLNDSRNATASAEASATTLRAKFDDALESHKNTEKELADICKARTEEIEKVERYNCIIEGLTEQIEAKDKDLKGANQRIVEDEKKQQESDITIRRLQAALEKYRNDLSGVEAMLHSTEAESVDVKARLKSAQEEIALYQSRIREIEQLGETAVTAYAQQIVELRNNIERIRRDAFVQQGRYEERLQQAQSAFEAQVGETKGVMQLLENALISQQLCEEDNMRLRQEMEVNGNLFNQQLAMLSNMFGEGAKRCEELARARKRDSGVGMDGDDAVMSIV